MNQRKKAKEALLRKQERRGHDSEALHPRRRHRGHRGGGALCEQRARPKRFARRGAERREHGVVPGDRARELVDLQRVAFDDGERALAARDLVRRSNEGGEVVTSSEAEVEEVLAGPAGRAEDEDSHVFVKTGPATKT